MSDRSAAPVGGEHSYLDVVDYLRILRRRKRWILVAVAVGIALAMTHFLLSRPIYVSTARVLVEETNVNPLEGASPVDLETEREVALSTPVARIAKESMGSDMSASDLLRQVTVDVPGESQVLEIRYEASRPGLAREGAGAFASAYLEYRRQQAEAVSERATKTIELRVSEILEDIATLTQEISESTPGTEEHARAIATRSGLKAEADALRAQIAGLSGVSTDPGAIIGAPAEPRSPASPSFPLDLALGLGGGAFIGAVLALFRERTDSRIRGHLDLEKVLGVPTLAFVPHVRTWEDEEEPVLLSRDAPHDPAAEGYRLLRTHLLLAAHMAGGAPQVVVVTSAFPGEGKTTTVANLGVVLAHSEKETIVVSADFRRPRLHRFLGLPDNPGLSDVLAGTARLEDAFQPTSVDHLSLVGSGEVGAAAVELLRPENIRELTREFVEVSGGFDFLIVDAPPLLPVADTLAMVSAVDQVLFVVDASKTQEPALRRSRELLQQVDAEVLGSFLNNYHPPAQDRYDGYGYGYALDGDPEAKWKIAGVAIPGLGRRRAAGVSEPSRRLGRGR